VRTQLWSLSHGQTLWRVAPGLYYRMLGKVIRKSIATHGPPVKTDFDDKLVRGHTLPSAQLPCSMLYQKVWRPPKHAAVMHVGG